MIIIGLAIDARISEIQKVVGNTIHNPSPSESLAVNVLYIIGGISVVYGVISSFFSNKRDR